MKPVRLIYAFIFAILMTNLPFGGAIAQSNPPENTARVGVLAFRGGEITKVHWQPLIDYLTATVDGWNFELVPVTLVSAPEKIEQQKVDFLITNPGHYVELAQQYGLSALATREKRVGRVGLLQYGVTIVALESSGFQTLDDLRGRQLAAVSPDAFGGFQLAWHAFNRINIDLFEDLKPIRFMGFPQDAIVMAVLEQSVDAGVVRSGLLEKLAAEERIDLDDFVVLQNDTQLGYPHLVSGSLYPEWPFTATPGVDKILRENVALALLSTQNPSLSEKFSLTEIWSAPLSYEGVRLLVSDFHSRDDATDPSFLGDIGYLASFAIGAAATFGFGAIAFALRPRRRLLEGAEPVQKVDNDDTVTDQEILRFQSLTKRECEVLAMICQGEQSKSIAEKLGISPKTVEYHRANLLQKTKAGTSAHLVQLATRIKYDLGITLGDFGIKHR